MLDDLKFVDAVADTRKIAVDAVPTTFFQWERNSVLSKIPPACRAYHESRDSFFLNAVILFPNK